ncbi:MAG TPA: hypothetical protein VKV24_02320 [Casimicrobiaceae bacterium]|nr:hypothetical protein [Casimicrobiaceae bacterium]
MRGAIVASVATALALSCAAPAVRPGVPREAQGVEIAPYEAYEECADLVRGDRLDYRYQSTSLVDFDIRYREGDAVLSPIVREQSTQDSGIFAPRVPTRYCLHWQAGRRGAIIGFRVIVHRN